MSIENHGPWARSLNPRVEREAIENMPPIQQEREMQLFSDSLNCSSIFELKPLDCKEGTFQNVLENAKGKNFKGLVDYISKMVKFNAHLERDALNEIIPLIAEMPSGSVTKSLVIFCKRHSISLPGDLQKN